MKQLYKYSILLVLLLVQVQAEKKLVFLSELCRHGARSPMWSTLDAHTAWKPPTSQLTQVGMRQHYLLGRQFNKEYIQKHKLLQVPYNDTDILVKTTSASRTQMSAQSQLYGLYFQEGENMPESIVFQKDTSLPPLENLENGEQNWKEIGDLNLPFSYQPVPTYGQFSSSDDTILSPSSTCKRIGQIQDENMNSYITKAFISYLEQNGIFERFRQIFEIPDEEEVTLTTISHYYDTLVCDQYQQIPFPKSMNEIDWEWIQFVYHYQQLYLDFGTTQNLQLQGTNFLRDLIAQIDDALFYDSGRKFMFYSASDGNLNVVNIIFGVTRYTTNFFEWKADQTKHSNTPFASTILFEIYEEDGSFYVVYKYNGKNYDVCGVGSDYCPYEQFRAMTEKWILSSKTYETQCTPFPEISI